jgi:pyruvate/2-oxoglutarate dehydrogenase complex dihydrolipoamide acyltransferase (E2) component
MGKIVEVRMPKYPECWESCGNCAQGEVYVIELHSKVGDTTRFDDPLITMETGKVALDIPSPYAGRVVELRVDIGDQLAEGQVIALIETD